MSTLVAIDIDDTEATFVTAEASRAGKVTLIRTHRCPLTDLASAGEIQAPPAGDDTALPAEINGVPPESPNGHSQRKYRLEDFAGPDVDLAFATLPAPHILYEYLNLPFHDPRRLEQVVPLQLQDVVPFDVEDFVVDSVVVNTSGPTSYDVLSSLVPKRDVGEALSRLSEIGASPKLLTTRASAISALVQLNPGDFKGTFGILLIGRRQASVALFVNSVLRSLREIRLTGEPDSPECLNGLFRDLRCSIARLEHEHSVALERLYVVGSETTVSRLSGIARMPFTALDLSRLIEVSPDVAGDINEYAWALGLFISEITPTRSKTQRLIDFRRGDFAFKPGLRNLMEAVQDEIEWFIFLAVGVIAWLGSLIYIGSAKVGVYEEFIRQQIATALPGEAIPYRREREFLEQKITDLRTQLEEVGSLSSLSPLDAVKELSSAMPAGIDMIIDSITIRANIIEFSGSVDSVPTLGRVSGALEKNRARFCTSRVDSKGKISGQQRVKFDGEVAFCE